VLRVAPGNDDRSKRVKVSPPTPNRRGHPLPGAGFELVVEASSAAPSSSAARSSWPRVKSTAVVRAARRLGSWRRAMYPHREAVPSGDVGTNVSWNSWLRQPNGKSHRAPRRLT
jgi:hypothetical protein